MILKITFYLTLLCCSFCMRVSDSNPQRNMTIVKVLAAHCNIGVQSTIDGYVYTKGIPFYEIAEKFIDFYKQQPIKTYSNEEQAVIRQHKARLVALINKVNKSGKANNINQTQQLKGITLAEQLQLASDILAELDQFYLHVYGILTDSPDKYIGLLNSNKINVDPMDSVFDSMRSVLAFPALQDMPKTYLYFHTQLNHTTAQYDQNGVIEAIFDLIGNRNYFFAEVGGGTTYDNTMDLRIEKGWDGLLLNSGLGLPEPANTSMLRMQMVTPENVVSIFQQEKVPKELDYLSIDIDGNDYWVAKALFAAQYRPAVFSMEFNSNFPASFSASLEQGHPDYQIQGDKIYGANTRAIYQLGRRYGYSLVYHMVFTDIFMVRDDLLPAQFRGMKLEDTYDAFPINLLTFNMTLFQTEGLLEKEIIEDKSKQDNSKEDKSEEDKSEEDLQNIEIIQVLKIFGLVVVLLAVGKLIHSRMTKKTEKNIEQFQISSVDVIRQEP